MSGAHIHLALTHVPVIGTLFGLLLLAYAFFANKPQVMRVSWVLFALCGLVSLAVYFTGEAAEEIIEANRAISETLIERHEEAGLIALVSMLVLGGLAGLGLLFYRQTNRKWFPGLVLIAALLTSGVLAWTANLGGQISHPEIRSVSATSFPANGNDTGAEAHEDDD